MELPFTSYFATSEAYVSKENGSLYLWESRQDAGLQSAHCTITRSHGTTESGPSTLEAAGAALLEDCRTSGRFLPLTIDIYEIVKAIIRGHAVAHATRTNWERGKPGRSSRPAGTA